MIKVKRLDKELRIEGHTLPDICSAVSSVTTTIVNCFEELCDKDEYEYTLSSGNCVIKVLKETPITNKLYNILVTELNDLSQDFPDSVEMK
jgi:uncharacterized protein YsxB (DUF464 family)